MEKKTVGRPKKTSTKVIKEKKYVNWKEQHDLVASELAMTRELLTSITDNANGVVQQQADNQLDLVKLILDSYNTIEKQCEEAVRLTGRVEQSDVMYLAGFARRALLHKFVEFNEAQED
jgi:hypothetical protein